MSFFDNFLMVYTGKELPRNDKLKSVVLPPKGGETREFLLLILECIVNILEIIRFLDEHGT